MTFAESPDIQLNLSQVRRIMQIKSAFTVFNFV